MEHVHKFFNQSFIIKKCQSLVTSPSKDCNPFENCKWNITCTTNDNISDGCLGEKHFSTRYSILSCDEQSEENIPTATPQNTKQSSKMKKKRYSHTVSVQNDKTIRKVRRSSRQLIPRLRNYEHIALDDDGTQTLVTTKMRVSMSEVFRGGQKKDVQSRKKKKKRNSMGRIGKTSLNPSQSHVSFNSNKSSPFPKRSHKRLLYSPEDYLRNLQDNPLYI